MRIWSRTSEVQELGSEAASSQGERNSIAAPVMPVWVNHTPTPSNISDCDDDDDDKNSTGHAYSIPPCTRRQEEEEDDKGSLKNKLKSLLRYKWTRESDSCSDAEARAANIQILPNGTRVSPPVSPFIEHKNWAGSLGNSSQNSHRQLLKGVTIDEDLIDESLISSIHPAEYYAEKLEVYNQKYSYLKSWPGLLRLLAGLELLFGGIAVACVIAYVQKDSEWSNTYGLYNGVYNNGLGVSGYSYNGPMTLFVLATAGISWIITFCLLVVGITMYYRTILLDSPWWPLTEAFINVALFLLYMAAGIVYLNDLNRGGLCYMTVGVSPILANLCRVDGGQMAGTAFIFINMTLYLGSFVVCLRMWKHEAARRRREYCEKKHHGRFRESIPLECPKTKHSSFMDETDFPRREDHIGLRSASVPDVQRNPVRPKRDPPPEHTLDAFIVADYIMKYPAISSVEEREEYKAVFNDQYQEYKDLYRDISVTLDKFRELDAMMEQLLREGKSQEDHQRIQSMLKTYQQKKRDPAFLDKKQRCEYLKAKLQHIKNRIRIFDQQMLKSHQA